MFKNILIISAAILYSLTLNAQRGQLSGRSSFEQVEAEKIAFFTRYLELTSEEAKKFWPVYDDFQDRRSKLVKERQSISRYFSRNYDTLPEKEAGDLADRYIDLQTEESKLAEEFHEKFKEVLPQKKVMRFYQGESEFRMQLLRRLRRGGAGRGPGGPVRE